MMTLKEKLRLQAKVERWLAAGGVKALFIAHEQSERIKKQVADMLQPVSNEMTQPVDL